MFSKNFRFSNNMPDLHRILLDCSVYSIFLRNTLDDILVVIQKQYMLIIWIKNSFFISKIHTERNILAENQ